MSFLKRKASMVHRWTLRRILIVNLLLLSTHSFPNNQLRCFHTTAAVPILDLLRCARRTTRVASTDENWSGDTTVTNTVVVQQNEDDKAIICQQLGYLPTNYLRVSARTQRTRTPIAIQTYPLQGGSPRRQAKAASVQNQHLGTPFPTLFWFTNPDIGAAIATLERQGAIRQLQQDMNVTERALLRDCHQQYATCRWQSLELQHRTLLLNDPTLDRILHMLQSSGVAGTNVTLLSKEKDITASIKCLHAHYAQFRSQPEPLLNPVGVRVHDLLQKQFPYLEL